MKAVFFPRSDYNVEVCNHRYGKAMTYTEQTDGMKLNSFYKVMALAETYGIKVGAFTNAVMGMDTIPDSDALAYINKGLLWTDAYWRYSGETNQTEVDETTFNEKNAEQVESFVGRWGRKPISFSYGLGNYTYKDFVGNKYLGARNSYYNGDTDYGKSFGNDYLGTPQESYSFSRFTYKNGSTRFLDYAERSGIGYATSLQNSKDIIDAAYLSHGWVNNFHHWHDFIAHDHEDWLNGYFAMLAQKKSQYNDNIHFCGYGEAVAYLVYRTLITRAVMYSPVKTRQSQLVIRLEAQNTMSIDTDLLQIPISVKFSTVGTPLAGKTLTSKCNLISLGNGDYIVEIPYTGRFPYAVING